MTNAANTTTFANHHRNIFAREMAELQADLAAGEINPTEYDALKAEAQCKLANALEMFS